MSLDWGNVDGRDPKTVRINGSGRFQRFTVSEVPKYPDRGSSNLADLMRARIQETRRELAHYADTFEQLVDDRRNRRVDDDWVVDRGKSHVGRGSHL